MKTEMQTAHKVQLKKKNYEINVSLYLIMKGFQFQPLYYHVTCFYILERKAVYLDPFFIISISEKK